MRPVHAYLQPKQREPHFRHGTQRGRRWADLQLNPRHSSSSIHPSHPQRNPLPALEGKATSKPCDYRGLVQKTWDFPRKLIFGTSLCIPPAGSLTPMPVLSQQHSEVVFIHQTMVCSQEQAQSPRVPLGQTLVSESKTKPGAFSACSQPSKSTPSPKQLPFGLVFRKRKRGKEGGRERLDPELHQTKKNSFS